MGTPASGRKWMDIVTTYHWVAVLQSPESHLKKGGTLCCGAAWLVEKTGVGVYNEKAGSPRPKPKKLRIAAETKKAQDRGRNQKSSGSFVWIDNIQQPPPAAPIRGIPPRWGLPP
jgi:hypothetical protein